MTDIGAELARLRKDVDILKRASRLSSASLDDTALEVRDDTGSLRGILGQQGDGTTAVNIVNGGPPPAPATPTAAPALGGVSVGWDGAFADGAIIPLDWARVEVHASPDAAFTPTADTLKATIETAQGGIIYVPTAAPLYVQLLARNTSGAASPATTEVGPYAPKPVAGEIGIGEITETLIADGAVTTPKVYANAVTTAKLAAGSVDATALKADAITGKTITGGVINGAEFHSDDGAGGLVDIADGTVVATAANGRKIAIDPANNVPILYFMDAEGDESGAINATSSDTLAGLSISSGPFTEGAVTDYRWVQTLGELPVPPYNVYQVSRTRSSDLTSRQGGFIFLDGAKAQFGIQDTTDSTVNTLIQFTQGLAAIDEARLLIDPPASANSALYVSTKTGHTGNLIRAQVNSVDRFNVTAAGAVVAASSVSAASASITGAITGASLTTTGTATATELAVTDTTFTAYTPTVAGGGTATFTSRTGWYYKLGKLVYFNAQFIVNAAGSGGAAVTITAPSSIYRGTRQVFPAHGQGTTVSGSVMNGHAVSLETGSGAVIDRISLSNNTATNRDNILLGSELPANAQVSISGYYREA